ncbi:MAG: ThiF family adenylyltransferase [Coxiellaceae bacterium]|nr:ThiF family adenylyltransferase [Coxiellaceae bacterium]
MKNAYICPNLKPVVEYCWSDGATSFFMRPGVSIDIPDSEKFVFGLCELMDGLKETDDLVKELSVCYPINKKILISLLDILNNEFLLEDSHYNNTAVLDSYTRKRWSRNIEFLSSYCYFDENKYFLQKRLMDSSVLILGLGGVGSNVLLSLSALGVRKITVIDYDVISLENLNRQVLYKEGDVGKKKSESAVNNIRELDQGNAITQKEIKISSAKQLYDLVCNKDLVVSAIDEPRDKILDWVNEACVRFGIPYIVGGLDSRWASCFTIVPGITGCMECWKIEARKKGMLHQEVMKSANFRSSGITNVAVMPLIQIVVGLISADAMKLLSGIAQPASLGKLLVYDISDSVTKTVEEWCIDEDCSVCNKVTMVS